MSAHGLGRRLDRLELAVMPDCSRRCETCGLEHARKVTVEEVRALVRFIGETPMPEPAPGTVRPGPFCLCACCSEYRALAKLTHDPSLLAR